MNPNYKKLIHNWRLKKSREKNYLTIKAHEYSWHKNLLRNSKSALFKQAKSINHIVAKEKGKRIWIVGAGFSLEDKGEWFKQQLQKDDVVFCLDASLRYLVLKLKIIPHYVFVLDSKKEGIRFFKDISDETYQQMSIVVSSAVDKEFLSIVEKFKQIYGFHMYDPSMPDWGNESCDTVAHKMLPNLNYVPNKGNVFNLALQVAYACEPKEVCSIGTEHCYLFDKNNKIRTRASVEDGFDYSVGGNFCRFDKIVIVEHNGNFFMTQGDYFMYARMAMNVIKNVPYKFIDYSGGLLS